MLEVAFDECHFLGNPCSDLEGGFRVEGRKRCRAVAIAQRSSSRRVFASSAVGGCAGLRMRPRRCGAGRRIPVVALATGARRESTAPRDDSRTQAQCRDWLPRSREHRSGALL